MNPTPTQTAHVPIPMGTPMKDIRIGMKLRATIFGGPPEIFVTELTPHGFKYTCQPFNLGPRYGVMTAGEHYGYEGVALYDVIDRAEGERCLHPWHNDEDWTKVWECPRCKETRMKAPHPASSGTEDRQEDRGESRGVAEGVG